MFAIALVDRLLGCLVARLVGWYVLLGPPGMECCCPKNLLGKAGRAGASNHGRSSSARRSGQVPAGAASTKLSKRPPA